MMNIQMTSKNSILNKGLSNLKGSKFIKDTAYMFSAKMGATVLGFLGSVIIIRELGPLNFGLYATAIAFINTITSIADFGLTTAVIKFGSFYMKNDKRKANLLFKMIGKQKLLICLAVTVLGLLSSKIIAIGIYNKPELVFPLQISMAYIAMSIVTNYIFTIIEARQQFLKSSLLNFSIAGIKLLSILALYYIFNLVTLNNMLFLLIGLGLFSIGFCSFFLDKNFLFSKGENGEDIKIRKETWRFSKWVMISTLCFPLAKRLDIIMLNYYVDSSFVGIYACAFQLALPLRTLKGTFHSILLPKISKVATYIGYINYIKKTTLLMFVVCLTLVPIIIFADPMIRFVIGEKYNQSVYIFQILLIKMIFVLLFNPLHLIAYSAGHPWIISGKDILALFINIIANIILIPTFGNIGAAYGTLLTSIIGGIIPIFYIYYKILIPMNIRDNQQKE